MLRNDDLDSASVNVPYSAFGNYSWNTTTHVLHVDGVVFVDGDLDLGDDGSAYEPIWYEGAGTFVVNGKVRIHQQLRPLVLATYPAVNTLGLVSNYTAGHSGDASVDVTIDSTPPVPGVLCDFDVAAAIFGKKLVHLGPDVRMSGGVVAGALSFAPGAASDQTPILASHGLLSWYLPPRMPGTDRVIQVVDFHELSDGAPGVTYP